MNLMVTSGHNFEGYKIIKYCGFIFVRDHVKDSLITSDKQYDLGIERAMGHIQNKAEALNANAIIGLKIEPFSWSSANTMLATSGTAVVVEKVSE